jgi:prophage maintenance system killer protein
MAKVKRGKSIDAQHLGTEPVFSGEYVGSNRKMVLLDALNYYNYKFKLVDHRKVCVEYAKGVYTGTQLTAITACPNYGFSNALSTMIRIGKRGWEYSQKEQDEITAGFERIINIGSEVAPAATVNAPKVDKPNPAKRLEDKIFATIMNDLVDLEDEWITGHEKVSIDIFTLVQAHGISGAKAAPYINSWAEERIREYERALSDKTEDAQFKEAYSHLTTAKIKKRIGILRGIMDEAEQLKLSAKATRKPRKTRAKSADKQVEKVQYEKVSTEYKLTSINPVSIIGAHHLYAFNVKKRTLTMFVTTRIDGFEVKGSTLLHIDPVESITVKLRDPNSFMKIVLKKTKNQISKEWGKLTTKTAAAPSGRLVKDHILLRVI